MLIVRPKHIIPNPGGDAEALVVGFEVMRHVVAAEFHEILALEAEMVQSVVGQVIDHITNQKPSENPINIIRKLEQSAHHPQEQPIEDCRKRNTDHRRHHQPALFPRLGMMDPVH